MNQNIKIYYSQTDFYGGAQIDSSCLDYSETRPQRASGVYSYIHERASKGSNKAVIQNVTGIFKFSLIMPTIGRLSDIEKFLNSLVQQSYKNYELIVVDQSNSDAVVTLLNRYRDQITELQHIRMNALGASRARNEGLKYATGDIITFPDDDCEYEPHLLEKAVQCFTTTNYDVITATHVGDWPKQEQSSMFINLNIYNIWLHGIEFVIFLRKKVIAAIGNFDESLGVGSGTIYGSGEGTDYLLRVLQQKFTAANCNNMYIKHEIVDFDKPEIWKKAFRYSVGRRYVLDKYHYNYFFVLLNIWYPLLKLLINVYSFKKIKYYWFQFLGRVKFFNTLKI